MCINKRGRIYPFLNVIPLRFSKIPGVTPPPFQFESNNIESESMFRNEYLVKWILKIMLNVYLKQLLKHLLIYDEVGREI